MERMIMDAVSNWYDNGSENILFISGAKGVGKTWFIKEFCRLKNIPALLTFDDINSREALEYAEKEIIKLEEDNKLSDCKVIMAGRIMDEAFCGEQIAGKSVRNIYMYPMNYVEFHTAISEKYDYDDYNMLKLYMVVGGLPKCVYSFINEGDLTLVRALQRELVSNIHVSIPEGNKCLLEKCRHIIKAIPVQKDEGTGFKLRKVHKNARDREYGVAIECLERYGIVYRLERLAQEADTESRNYKLIFYDIGLFGAMAELDERMIFSDEAFSHRALIANYIVQELVSYGIRSDWNICYWHKPRAKAKLPVVLVSKGLGNGKNILPVDIMGKENLRTKSMKSFLEIYSLRHVIRFLTPSKSIRSKISQSDVKEDIEMELYRVGDIGKYIEELISHKF